MMDESMFPHFIINETLNKRNHAIPFNLVEGCKFLNARDFLKQHVTVEKDGRSITGELTNLFENRQEALDKINGDQSLLSLTKRIDAQQKTINELTAKLKTVEMKLRSLEKVVNDSAVYELKIIPDLNFAIRPSYLMEACKTDHPLKTVDFIIMEIPELKAIQNIKWSKLSAEQRKTLESLFNFVLAERNLVQKGFQLDQETVNFQASKLKIAYQKRLINMQRPTKKSRQKSEFDDQNDQTII